MLNDIFPEQFIEGINESEVPDDEFPIFGSYGVAIPYTPSINYILTSVNIFVSPSDLEQPKEHVVKIYTDHNDNLSEICLIDGKITVPSHSMSQWLQIKLNQGVAVFSGHKYWLCFPEDHLDFVFGVSENGKELSLRANPSGRWTVSRSDRRYRFMLRFYGRVIPVATKYDMESQTQ